MRLAVSCESCPTMPGIAGHHIVTMAIVNPHAGGLRSEASAREAFHPQDAFCSHPESYYGPDMQALATGGSFSSPALYFCPACGIKATSQPNLEVKWTSFDLL